MPTLFISDLHLAPERPALFEQFRAFTDHVAREAEAVYVLGDLFEYWIGDDDLDEAFNANVADALGQIPARGTPLYLMRGNRDVLAGQTLAQRCGATLIEDPTPVTLYGVPTLLMHGDSLCTDDLEYQKFRSYARNPANQQKLLALPRAARRAHIQGLRQESEEKKQDKTAEIMDVSPVTVAEVLREHGYPRLIHGHTHRPAHHVHAIDGHRCERWVLNDWYARGGYLRCDPRGCELVQI